MSSTPTGPAGQPLKTGNDPAVKPTTPGTATPPAGGPGVVRKTTNGVKRVILVLLGAFAALFAVFNSQDVAVDYFPGQPSIQIPLILVIVVALAVGFAIGWIIGRYRTGGRA